MAWDKTQLRRETAARLEMTMQYSDAEIAAAIGLTPGGYAQMKIQPEYIAIRNAIKHGVIAETDDVLGDNITAMRERVQNMIPASLQALADAVTQRRDLKLAATTAIDIIKIDGRMAPVSRTGAALPDQGGDGKFDHDDDVANALNVALAKRAAKEKGETIQ